MNLNVKKMVALIVCRGKERSSHGKEVFSLSHCSDNRMSSGKEENPQQPVGGQGGPPKNSHNKSLYSTMPHHHLCYKFTRWNVCKSFLFFFLKSWSVGVQGGWGSLRGDWPHFLPVHSCERNQQHFPLSLFLPQFMPETDMWHSITQLPFPFASLRSQWDKIFQWQLFCSGFYCGALQRQDMLWSILWVASRKLRILHHHVIGKRESLDGPVEALRLLNAHVSN